MVNGVYDQAALDKLNWFMRDWRLNEPTKMDPHLFDIIWEVYRESGSTPADRRVFRLPLAADQRDAAPPVASGGRAFAAHAGQGDRRPFPGRRPGRIRDIAMRMQEGGVGFYPQGLTWVHIDSGSVRYWPRMSREALTRLFPDGKTVFIPADGQPMPGYELAQGRDRAARRRDPDGRAAADSSPGSSGMFGGGADDAEELGGQETAVASSHIRTRRRQPRRGPGAAPAAGRGRRRRTRGGRQGEARSADGPDLRRPGACCSRARRSPARPDRGRIGARACSRFQAAGRRRARAAAGRERRAAARRRSSSRGRSQRFISRRCRRGGRPISSCNSRCSPTFPCRPSGRPTFAATPSAAARGDPAAAGPARPSRAARAGHSPLAPDVTASIAAPAGVPPVVASIDTRNARPPVSATKPKGCRASSPRA